MFSSAFRRAAVRSGVVATAAAVQAEPARKVQAEEVPVPCSYSFSWFSDQRTGHGLLGPRWAGPSRRAGERSFKREEVAQRDGTGSAGAIWVTYRDGVYDVTDYVKVHPGGKFILSAAGGPVDSWWAFWAAHHLSTEVAAALEKMRVGHLSDWVPEVDEERRGGGAYEEEQSLPSRAENRRCTQSIAEMPYQSVTKCEALMQAHLTPNDALFVRNHAPVPSISVEDAAEHTVSFCLDDSEVASLSLEDFVKRFETVEVTSVLQCTGNRASDNISDNGVEQSGFTGSDDEFIGLGMLGNVRWRGVRLSEVVRELMPPEVRAEWCEHGEDLHVTFEGADGYYNSMPLKHVMSREKDCLLATHMNGAALLPDHGFPVRVVLPGCAGARQVKWLSKVSVGPASDSPWVKHFYLDKPAMRPVYNLPLNSVILSPEPGALIDAMETNLTVHGVAYSGGTDLSVEKVEVSYDRGQSWHQACCLFDEVLADDSSKPRGWVRFNVELNLPPARELGCGGPLTEIWCRAVDEAGGTQPRRCEAHGGYIYNGYHKVPVVRRPLSPQ